ncbi:MAG TPA: hypothetical protein VGS96_07030 [Thermoanaerobaculia bacterium]|nr:hypothetical protein [Thermoanaerobaculia bacterium]
MTDFSSRVYRFIFTAAAAYNIAFGLWAALFPRAFFRLFHLAPPRYPGIWACLGMVVGLYGAGYAYAAWRLDRAVPFIAIGLAGKVLGPIGWVLSVGSAELPARTFPLIVFDDLIWWLPFSMFLLEGTAVTEFLKRTAPYCCAALHVVAAAGTLFLLRGGSEAVADIHQRIGYLGEHPDRWRAGWLLWMIAALSLAGFYAWWSSRTSRSVLPIVVASIGLSCDFAGEALLIGWIPQPDTTLYRAATLLTGGAGNGFYTIAAILLTLASPLPALLRVWAWLTWMSGLALTIFTIGNMSAAVVISSAVLMILFIPLVVAIAIKLR